jgi:hypothetical protein
MRRPAILFCLTLLAFPGAICAQQDGPAAPTQLPDKPVPVAKAPTPPPAHRFWDKRNAWLFAGVAASRALDFHSTGNMRRRGRDEILLTNEVVDNKPAFAAIEVAGALTSIGISYLFHRAGHHRLEHWVSYLHIGGTTFGAARNYSLHTSH